jgi:hypothetical protein
MQPNKQMYFVLGNKVENFLSLLYLKQRQKNVSWSSFRLYKRNISQDWVLSFIQEKKKGTILFFNLVFSLSLFQSILFVLFQGLDCVERLEYALSMFAHYTDTHSHITHWFEALFSQYLCYGYWRMLRASNCGVFMNYIEVCWSIMLQYWKPQLELELHGALFLKNLKTTFWSFKKYMEIFYLNYIFPYFTFYYALVVLEKHVIEIMRNLFKIVWSNLMRLWDSRDPEVFLA